MNRISPFTTESLENSCTLARNVSAIQILTDHYGGMRLGTILQLPEGARLRFIGDGFNERTVKVSWEGANYFVFLEDLTRDELLTTGTSAGR